MKILLRDKSLLDGTPIVGVLSGGNGDGPSTNEKTGPMVQLWILPDFSDPLTLALNSTGGICPGSCPMTAVDPDTGRQTSRCYVDARVWRGMAKRSVGLAVDDMETIDRYVSGRAVRLGAFGDPAACDPFLLYRLLEKADSHTGYTHAWASPLPWLEESSDREIQREGRKILRHLCMASVESLADAELAQSMGYRTFRITPPGVETAEQGEVVCPAITHGTQCANCSLCSGDRRPDGYKAEPDQPMQAVPSITVPAHGGAVAIKIAAKAVS